MSAERRPSDEERNPFDRLLDVSVYAPLGFALEFRRLVPELAEAGRRQIEFSRSLGRAALRTMARSGATAAQGSARAARNDAVPSSARSGPAQPHAAPPSAPPIPPSDVEASVEGFDTMNARTAIAQARRATAAQLAWMRERELATKKRTTVLDAIERASDG